MYLFLKIELFEDLFSPYMSGTITLNDSLNIAEVLPITGQEKLEIEFKTPVEQAEPVYKIFRVYKLDKHTVDQNGKGQKYTLHFISEGGLINYSQRCGYSVYGSVSEMVKTVVSKHFPDNIWKDRFQVETTKDNYSFVLPKTYTPYKAISWLSTKAISSVAGDYSPFLFYETFDGYCFKSLSSIIKTGSESSQDYYFIKEQLSSSDGSPTSLSVDGPLSAIFHKVQMLEEISRFDMAENIMQGSVSSRLVIHDLTRKEKREVFFRESDVFEDSIKLGDFPHYKSTDVDDSIFYQTPSAYYYLPSTSFNVYNDQNNISDNNKLEEYFLKRKYFFNTMMTQRIAISVYGDSTKRVGQVINLYTPKISADQAVQDDKQDKNFSGKYLITSIRHTFTNNYTCKIELSRNAMGV